MTNPTPLNERGAVTKSTLFGVIFATALAGAAFVNVCSARTDGTAGASDAVESLPPAATIERSGSLAVYPLLY